jgi:hypothetical protein
LGKKKRTKKNINDASGMLSNTDEDWSDDDWGGPTIAGPMYGTGGLTGRVSNGNGNAGFHGPV